MSEPTYVWKHQSTSPGIDTREGWCWESLRQVFMWRVLYVAFITITVHIYYITDYISPERARSSSDTCHFCEKVTFVLVF